MVGHTLSGRLQDFSEVEKARATSLCLRGSRVKWRSGLGMDDGAPLYSIL